MKKGFHTTFCKQKTKKTNKQANKKYTENQTTGTSSDNK